MPKTNFSFLVILLLTQFFLLVTPVMAAKSCKSQGITLTSDKPLYGDGEKINISLQIGEGEFKTSVNKNDKYRIEVYSSNKPLATSGETTYFDINIHTQTMYSLNLNRINVDDFFGSWPIGSYTIYLRRKAPLVNLDPNLRLGLPSLQINYTNRDVCSTDGFEVIPTVLVNTTCSFHVPSNIEQNTSYTVKDLSINQSKGIKFVPLLYQDKKPLSSFKLGIENPLIQKLIASGTLLVGKVLLDSTSDETKAAEDMAKKYLDFDLDAGKLVIKDNLRTNNNGYTLAIQAKMAEGAAIIHSGFGIACFVDSFNITNNPTTDDELTKAHIGSAPSKESAKKGPPTFAGGELCDNNTGIKTAIGCIHTQPVEFVKDFMKFAIGISGGLAFLMMLSGAFQMITSSGNPETLKAGQDRLTSAVIGLLMVVFATLLLQIIGVDILKIPGLGK